MWQQNQIFNETSLDFAVVFRVMKLDTFKRMLRPFIDTFLQKWLNKIKKLKKKPQNKQDRYFSSLF